MGFLNIHSVAENQKKTKRNPFGVISKFLRESPVLYCLLGFRTFRQKTFRQKHGGGRFGKKNMPKRLRLKTFAETFRMIDRDQLVWHPVEFEKIEAQHF